MPLPPIFGFSNSMVAFKRVTAPFPGIITARNTNVGDLIYGE